MCMPVFCDKTQKKFHSSPSLQYSLQNPSLISHFTWKILAPSYSSTKARIKHSSECPIWSIAPPGSVFYFFSFTDGMRPCGVNFNKNDRSRIDMNALNLWCIAAISDNFIFFGILHFMSSYSTICARFDDTLSWPKQKNKQWCHLSKRTHVVPSWLPHGFLHWSNRGQSWQGNLQLHTLVTFHMRSDGLPTPTGTCYFDACQVVAAQLEKPKTIRELTNITVVPAPPDGCGVFSNFSCAAH